jgi:peptidoglycan/LPS O-acetylase OafA/YrhL
MESASQRLGHRPAVDGLHGVSVLLVICVEVGAPARGGFGVDIFFALSGLVR